MGLKLHLGCGWRDFGKGWVHIDGGNYPHVTSHDITKLPFGDESTEIIYSSHVLEYFDREEVSKVLNEWRRVLISKGIIRIAVPDFESISNLYSQKKFPLSSFLGPLYGKMEIGKNGGERGVGIYHKTAYDFQELSSLLVSNGFCNVHKYDWKTIPPHNSVDDHSQCYLPSKNFVPTPENPFDKHNGFLISLNVEAEKK
jgi:predicted SAM-dependent methyltransferase